MANRRQPVRQARTANSQSLRTGRRGISASQDDRLHTTTEIGFFPAITGFTDAIVALPKEIVRHVTLWKEVDAKLHHQETDLRRVVLEILRSPAPSSRWPGSQVNEDGSTRAPGSSAASAHSQQMQPALSQQSAPSVASQQAALQDHDIERRLKFFGLREKMATNISTLDEKIHVLHTASDTLERQLDRLQSFYDHVPGEVSEEARFGNLNHWAYVDRSYDKRVTITHERPRREAAVNNTLTAAALGIEREVDSREGKAHGASRKRPAQIDSDFDDERPYKRLDKLGPGKKQGARVPNNATGLGIAGVQKEKKRTKATSANTSEKVVGKAMSGVYGPTTVVGHGQGSPKLAAWGLDAAVKRGKVGASANGTGRKRNGTNASATNSPLMASSPVIGTFEPTSVRGGQSPAPAMQRSTSTRNRQASTQVTKQEKESPKGGNSNNHTSRADAETNSIAIKSKQPDEAVPAEPDTRASSRQNDRNAVKREEPNAAKHRPPSISTSARNNGKASKTATPLVGTFPAEIPTVRPRSARTNSTTNPPAIVDLPTKRSHKKGAGGAVTSSRQGKENGEYADEDDEMVDGEEEETFCYCGGISYGEMIACDNEHCKGKWFHLDCTGMDKAPAGKTKWYCDDCKKKQGR